MSGCEACCGDTRVPAPPAAKKTPAITLPTPYPKFPDDGCSACCADKSKAETAKTGKATAPTKFEDVKAAASRATTPTPSSTPTPTLPAPTAPSAAAQAKPALIQVHAKADKPKPAPLAPARTLVKFEFAPDTPLPSTERPLSPNNALLSSTSSLPTSPLSTPLPRAPAERAPWPSHAATRMHLPSHTVREVRPGSPRDPLPQFSAPAPAVRRTSLAAGAAPALTPGALAAPASVVAVLSDAAVHSVSPATASALSAPVAPGRDAVHVEAVTPSSRLGSPFGTPMPKISSVAPTPPLAPADASSEEDDLLDGEIELELLAPPLIINLEPSSPTDVQNLGGSSGIGSAGDSVLDILASTRRPAPISALFEAYDNDTAALGACEAELRALQAALADAEADANSKRTRVLAYQVALDEELAALEAERAGLLRIREAIFTDSIKDARVLGSNPRMALAAARDGWCRLWVDA
ncbi:hypothetical protein CC85DRAFT_283979 [Cutaneotrichosporon oleaginosum]|uniref:Uncharacterized protein n=1 Tax=Cutaneotrichosporon oleaginosum TaxID=879819 RepID=A0A0J0XS92_9TREE|nr:uncharacterized protein CC85DRAFT_283979 [Cutaneotrichosporon oleaginosum]KLT43936.1 hypothetical protein CC85DRAFT_283979 [Cutaneotrichosporon oleaginosum]TXT04117.1 hypothetical protein COLE_07814 [Cutaneotrichosporon oleaginosum]